MSFRTVVIKNRAKLDFSLNYLVYRGEEIKKIHLSEISTLIIESTAVSLTAALINELIKNNVKVIFCDEKHLPNCQLMGFYDNYHSSKNIRKQISWGDDIKSRVWTQIISQKINNQAKLLKKYGLDDKLLRQYLTEIQPGDITNREGHAAKVYFNLLFKELSRRTPSFYNSALNYGYAILLSMFCREISASGFITQLGVWHCNEFNHYNLASDLMESFRVIVDDIAMGLEEEDRMFKSRMANIVNTKVLINNKKMYLDAAVRTYVNRSLEVLCSGEGKIAMIEGYELPIYENNVDV